MSTAAVAAAMLRTLVRDAGLPPGLSRTPIRVWARSRVERLTWPDGTTAVLKYAEQPFDTEHRALRHVAAHDVPVPAVLAARVTEDMLAMLMTDLGEPTTDATDDDGAAAIIGLHQIPNAPRGAPTVNEAELQQMPTLIRRRTRHLAPPALHDVLRVVDKVTPSRAACAHLPPFGMCHSEWHPTSLHIGRQGRNILDVARAFTGPGLLDLASWPGTIDNPDTDRVSALIEAYIRHGGTPHASDRRGGLDAASWALGWHRVWAADWFAEQIERGWADGDETTWTDAITRHLTEAAVLLKA